MKHYTKNIISSMVAITISLSTVTLPAAQARATNGTPVSIPESGTSLRSRIIIAELKTFGELGADDDFVELYNPNASTVNVTGWLLQYRTASTTPDKAWVDKSSAGKDQDTRARLGCGVSCQLSIAPHGRLLIASPAAKLPKADITPPTNLGFASTGGQIRLVSIDPSGGTMTQEDMVGYGKIASSGLPVATAEGSPALAHAISGSLKRKVDRYNELKDTDDNASDFELSITPTPGVADAFVAPMLPIPTTSDPLTDETTAGVGDTSTELIVGAPNDQTATPIDPLLSPKLIINELLPDPVAPYSDAKDEFIELYNSGDTVALVGGYRISIGATKSSSYTLPAGLAIEPHAYYTLYSKQSGLALSNGGTRVTLSSPSGDDLGAVSYDIARPGQVWALNSLGTWQWSTTPTPGADNLITLPAPLAVATKTRSSKASARAVATKSKSSKAVTKAKTLKASSSKKPKKNSAQKAAPAASPAKQDATVWVAGGMAMVTSGYLAYDYRATFRRLLLRFTQHT